MGTQNIAKTPDCTAYGKHVKYSIQLLRQPEHLCTNNQKISTNSC